MYHIFICDDEKRFTEVLEKRVETCLKEQGQCNLTEYLTKRTF